MEIQFNCLYIFFLHIFFTGCLIHNIFESAINKVSWTKLYMLDDHYECTIVYSCDIFVWLFWSKTGPKYTLNCSKSLAPGFVNYKKGPLDSQPQVIKFISCLPIVRGVAYYVILPRQAILSNLKYIWDQFCFKIVIQICHSYTQLYIHNGHLTSVHVCLPRI
jgi:hypothetical protein